MPLLPSLVPYVTTQTVAEPTHSYCRTRTLPLPTTAAPQKATIR
ncbi:hypothetical protein F444_01554 [Phytophthora nicotianae P1976]|uniref:Uncharacterized protein n=1 Tax=Phytophthora nicotianae P1976 TaxID=1317066 RepID=A0A081B085_PHYNI|nr:hypothetical protein F444_01554 [Phytophthora nicotianae P1976]